MSEASLTVDDLLCSTPLPVRTSVYLVGAKTAVLMDGCLVVSPAMWKLLMETSNQEEFERMAKAIPVLRIDTYLARLP